MANPNNFILKLDASKRPALTNLPEKVIADIGWYNANRATARIPHPVNGIEGVVIHSTAGGTVGGALSWWKDPKGGKASAHWLVPAEREPEHGKSVIAAVYETLAAWHVLNSKSSPKINQGRAKANHWTLGIEVVNTMKNSDPYSDWQVMATADIVRYCWAKYPNLKWVFSHAAIDSERRTDPGSEFPWDRFCVLVEKQSPATDFQLPAVAEGQFDGKPCCA